MKKLRITDGKGFQMAFDNGWRVSIQWGYGNYCDNYNDQGGVHGLPENWTTRDIRLGRIGSDTAECALFCPVNGMVKLPPFMFGPNDGVDVVSTHSSTAQVLQLLNFAAEQSATPAKIDTEET